MGPIEKLIIFAIITTFISVLILKSLKKKDLKQEVKDKILLILPLITIFIHLSIIIYDNLICGEEEINFKLFLPIFPCNVVMWLLLIVGLIKNKEGIVFKRLSEFCCLGGTVCGMIGIVVNTNFLNNQTFLDYGVFKGLLSHATMIFNCFYLFSMGYVKIRVKSNLISGFIGLLIFIACGFFVNTLFTVLKMEDMNSMFMQEPPFKEAPFFNFITMGILGLLLLFGFCAIYEECALEKEDRWYNKKFLEELR